MRTHSTGNRSALALLVVTTAVLAASLCPAPSRAEEENAAGAASIQIDLSRPAAPISRWLFGKFTEHLGRNIYHGMWAQILRNPGLESWEFFDDSGRWGRSARFEGCAAYWAPLSGAKARYALVADCALSGQHAQSITVEAAAPGVDGAPGGPGESGKQAGLKQEAGINQEAGLKQENVFLPLHRESDYVLSLRCRGEGIGAGFEVSVWSQSRKLSSVRFEAPGKDWEIRRAELTIPKGAAAAGSPIGAPPTRSESFTLSIEVLSPGTLVLDIIELFPADALEGFDRDVVRLCRDARLPLLRYPGGNFASGYHWRDGVGLRHLRPMKKNPAWPVPEYNHVGTDEFLAFCRLVGCEPQICINAGDGTPEEAAAWVEYVNAPVTAPLGELRARNGHPEPYGIRLWEIGNELYGDWQIGHATAAEYAERYLRFTKEMRAVDPGCIFIANGADAAWNRTVLERCGCQVRSLSVHPLIGGGTPPSADREKVFRALMAYPTAFEGDVRAQLAWAKERGLAPKIAVTELQIFTNRRELPSNSTLSEALFLGRFIHSAIRSEGAIEMITHRALVNHGGGLRKEREIVYAQPVQEAHVLYASMTGVRPVPVDVRCGQYSTREPGISAVDAAPDLDAVALLDGTGAELTLVVVNTHPRDAIVAGVSTIGSPGGAAWRPIRARVLAGDSYMATNTYERPGEVKLREVQPPVVGEGRFRFSQHSITEVVLGRPGA